MLFGYKGFFVSFYSFVCLGFFFQDRDGGTDLNLVFTHFLERMSFIKERVKAPAFQEHYHVMIVFTDGNFSVSMCQVHMWRLASLILIQINLKKTKKKLKGAAKHLLESWFHMPVIIIEFVPAGTSPPSRVNSKLTCFNFNQLFAVLCPDLFVISCFFFTTGIYNMGGSPLQTVERIKNMVYLNHTNQVASDNRAEHLGEKTFGHTHKTPKNE